MVGNPVRVRLRRFLLDGPGGYIGAAKRLGVQRADLYAIVEGGYPSDVLAEGIQIEYKISIDEWYSGTLGT